MSLSRALPANLRRDGSARRGSSRALALSVLLALGACTAGPVYGPSGVSPVTGQRVAGLEALAGRVEVSEAGSRTDQTVRNPLLFRLNGGTPVQSPLYEVSLIVTASGQDVIVQGGTGIPSASVYRMEAQYTVRRLSDGEVVGAGLRMSTAPYDRSAQIFAAERAQIDAREKAGAELADRVAAGVLPILRREIEGGRV